MTIEHTNDPHHGAMTILAGRLADQSAFIGVLNALHDIDCPILRRVDRSNVGVCFT